MPRTREALHRARVDLLRRIRRRPPTTRRWLPRGTGLDTFLRDLTDAGVRHVVLRPFDDPGTHRGDVDLLVADDDLAAVASRVLPHRRLLPGRVVNVYTVSGLPGTDLRQLPYVSRPLATGLLERAQLLHGRYRVPSPADLFDLLAYHLVYHEGRIPARAGGSGSDGEVLARLAEQTRLTTPLTLDDLDEHLQRRGLRPAGDTLERLQQGNPWLRQRLAADRPDIGHLAGLIVFAVREAAAEHLDAILTIVDRFGFEVLATLPLTGPAQERVRALTRGGNWGRGPYPASGGGPVRLVFAYDFARSAEDTGHGHVVSRNSTHVKASARDLIATRVPADARFNPLHSSDNGWQSLEYVAAVEDPELLPALQRRIEEIEAAATPPFPVVRPLSASGRRGRVAVVEHPEHGRVVVKMFRPGARASFERELEARRRLADTGMVPALLDHGDGWIVSPYYRDTGRQVLRRLPGTEERQLRFGVVLRLAWFVAELRHRGYFLLDLTSHNLVHDPVAGLRITDLEFLQRYPGAPPPLEADLTVVGTTDEPGVDRPSFSLAYRWNDRLRQTVFHPAISGLTPADVEDLLAGARPRLHAAAVQLRWYLAVAGRLAVRRTVPADALRGVRRLARALRR